MESLQKFWDSRVSQKMGNMVSQRALFLDYKAFCAFHSIEKESDEVVADFVFARLIDPKIIDSDIGKFYIHIALKDEPLMAMPSCFYYKICYDTGDDAPMSDM